MTYENQDEVLNKDFEMVLHKYKTYFQATGYYILPVPLVKRLVH